jgi:acetoin utilization deacetylase AcuC-like enzyme
MNFNRNIQETPRKDSFVKPEPGTDKAPRLVYTGTYVNPIKREPRVYDMGCLVSGGAIESAVKDSRGGAPFAVIRPPGHQGIPDSRWGFCSFDNGAMAMRKLMQDEKVEIRKNPGHSGRRKP